MADARVPSAFRSRNVARPAALTPALMPALMCADSLLACSITSFALDARGRLAKGTTGTEPLPVLSCCTAVDPLPALSCRGCSCVPENSCCCRADGRPLSPVPAAAAVPTFGLPGCEPSATACTRTDGQNRMARGALLPSLLLPPLLLVTVGAFSGGGSVFSGPVEERALLPSPAAHT